MDISFPMSSAIVDEYSSYIESSPALSSMLLNEDSSSMDISPAFPRSSAVINEYSSYIESSSVASDENSSILPSLSYLHVTDSSSSLINELLSSSLHSSSPVDKMEGIKTLSLLYCFNFRNV